MEGKEIQEVLPSSVCWLFYVQKCMSCQIKYKTNQNHQDIKICQKNRLNINRNQHPFWNHNHLISFSSIVWDMAQVWRSIWCTPMVHGRCAEYLQGVLLSKEEGEIGETKVGREVMEPGGNDKCWILSSPFQNSPCFFSP